MATAIDIFHQLKRGQRPTLIVDYVADPYQLLQVIAELVASAACDCKAGILVRNEIEQICSHAAETEDGE